MRAMHAAVDQQKTVGFQSGISGKYAGWWWFKPVVYDANEEKSDNEENVENTRLENRYLKLMVRHKNYIITHLEDQFQSLKSFNISKNGSRPKAKGP